MCRLKRCVCQKAKSPIQNIFSLLIYPIKPPFYSIYKEIRRPFRTEHTAVDHYIFESLILRAESGIMQVVLFSCLIH